MVCRAPQSLSNAAHAPGDRAHPGTVMHTHSLSMALHTGGELPGGITQTHPARGGPSACAMRPRQHGVDRCSGVAHLKTATVSGTSLRCTWKRPPPISIASTTLSFVPG